MCNKLTYKHFVIRLRLFLAALEQGSFEKLIVAHFMQMILTLNEPPRFTRVLTTASHWILQ